jgi:zinc-ribbon domain
MSSATSTRQGFNIFLGVGLALALGAIALLRGQNPASVSIVALTLLAAGLSGVALIRVLAPFTSGGAHGASPLIGGRRRAALERDKLLTLRSIKELEFDRAMGKVSEADFVEMRDRLRARALRLMRQLEGAALYQQMIERDVDAARATIMDQGSGVRGQDSHITASNECESCGTVNDSDARFCKECGKRLAWSLDS